MADAPDVAGVGYQGDNGVATGQLAPQDVAGIAAVMSEAESLASGRKSGSGHSLQVPPDGGNTPWDAGVAGG